MFKKNKLLILITLFAITNFSFGNEIIIKAKVKNEINKTFGSELVEVKSYEEY